MKELIFKFKNLHWTLISLVFFISFVGIVMIYSASKAEGLNPTYSHISKLILGIFIMFSVAMMNINLFQKYAYILYFVGLFFLIYATFYGFVGKGARRWINIFGVNVQPSEIMKIVLILAIAKFFDEKKFKHLKSIYLLFFQFF